MKAAIWLTDAPIPAEICSREPSLKELGFYRKLNDNVCQTQGQPSGCEEFISWCDKGAADYFAIYKTDFNNLLDRALPRRKTRREVK